MFRMQNKNVIHNANFNAWQRRTSFAAAATNSFSADRWKYVFSNDGVVTISQDTGVPNNVSTYSIKVDVTTSDGTIADDQYGYLQQGIEGLNFDIVRAVPMTLTFWVKSYQTGTFCVCLISSGADESFIAEYTVDDSATWEKKTIIIPPIPAGTWAVGTAAAAYLRFVFACGADNQGAAGWQAANDFATSNQSNLYSSTDNYIQFSQIQLEAGGVPSEFYSLPVELEVEICQRYFVGMDSGSNSLIFTNGMATAAETAAFMVYLPQEMRAVPSVDALTTTGWQPSKGTTNYQVGSISLSGTTDVLHWAHLQVTGSSGMTAGDTIKLSSSGANQYLGLSSEI